MIKLIKFILIFIAVLAFSFWPSGASFAQDLSVYRNPSAENRVPLNPEQQKPTAQTLQNTLVELIDLNRAAKQAHWNVEGPLFYELHILLDEFVEDYRQDSDIVAERLLAIHHSADGRPKVVSQTAQLPVFPEGYLNDYEVLDVLSQRLNTVTHRLRDRINTLDQFDLVSQDVLIEVERDLDEHLWMLREFQQQNALNSTSQIQAS
jgi:starvation-inducible DNA-binding protein